MKDTPQPAVELESLLIKSAPQMQALRAANLPRLPRKWRGAKAIGEGRRGAFACGRGNTYNRDERGTVTRTQ